MRLNSKSILPSPSVITSSIITLKKQIHWERRTLVNRTFTKHITHEYLRECAEHAKKVRKLENILTEMEAIELLSLANQLMSTGKWWIKDAKPEHLNLV